MTRLANAVFRAPLAVLRGQGGGREARFCAHGRQLALARPAGLKQSAMRALWPQGGHRGARQNAPLEMSPSKVYGFVNTRGFLPEMLIISDQPFRALSRGGGS
jgi:hypothetical protein